MPELPNHLVIFAKAPSMGRVKTRLGRDIGMAAAWAFYRQCLATISRRLAADPRWRTWLAITPDDAPCPPGLPANITLMAQGGGDLGTRMGNTMADLPPGPVAIIGTDIPDITRTLIAQAFDALGHTDAVFGPATDGGYWLAGCRRRPRLPDMFRDVRWSTEHALSDTLANVAGEGLSARLLDTLEDVDDGASYERWRQRPCRSVTPFAVTGYPVVERPSDRRGISSTKLQGLWRISS